MHRFLCFGDFVKVNWKQYLKRLESMFIPFNGNGHFGFDNTQSLTELIKKIRYENLKIKKRLNNPVLNKSLESASASFDVGIIGGGLAGLSLSILLVKAGHKVVLFEKEKYPFHRVCGEYISLESCNFIESLALTFLSLTCQS